MSRSGSRPSARVGLAALLLAVAASGCSASNPTPKTPKPAILPASARIVRTVDFVLPPVPLPPSAKPDAGEQAVVFLNASTGFVASGGQPLGTDQGGVYLPDPGGIERTGDGGKTWTTAWTAPGALLTWIGFAGPITGFAAGIQFETSSGTSSTSRPLLLRTTNAGITWTAMTPRMTASLAQSWGVLHFVFASPTLGIGVIDPDAQPAGAGSVMIRTTDGGQDWSQVTLQNWTPTGGLTFRTPSEAFATGYLPGPSTAGQLWTSPDAGHSWHVVPGTRVPFLLYAVDFPDRLHGLAAGGHYSKYEERPWRGLLASNDGGRTWSIRYQSPDGDRSNPLTRLHFVDANHGWAAIGGCTEGQNGPCAGAVMLTGDGGRSWHTSGHLALQLSPISPTEAWAIDAPRQALGVLWHSTDGGTSWQAVVRPGATGISLIGSQGWLLAVTPIGRWTSMDGGQTWQPFNPPMLGSEESGNATPTVVVEPPGLVLVADGPAVQVSQDGGRGWTTVTLPTEDPTNNAVAMAFSDSRNGVAIVGNQLCFKPQPGVPAGSATVLTTGDGGLTWKPQSSLARYSTGFSAAKGLAVTTGWAGCGPSQQSIAISRDDGSHWATQSLPFGCDSVSVAAPATIWLTCQTDHTFLLISQDGGQTWTQSQSTGLATGFLATGSSEGWAYGPAGALWHTNDAGRHWTAWVPSF